jgi:proteasome assembly chaperone (PAC2) family protein
MACEKLNMREVPDVRGGKILLAFSGWMDGGDVSTGTVQRLVAEVSARPFAEIDPEGFYIYNFPGAMELTAMFRPHIRIERGHVELYEPPQNIFYVDDDAKVVFFDGKEPNLNWRQFGDCVFEVARKTGVRTIFFVGSFGGAVPHTREPRLYATISHEQMIPFLKQYGIRFSDYEGPGSFVTYLMTRAEEHGIEMASLVAEIPGYLQGTNPISIEAVMRRLVRILDLPLDVAELRVASTEWELRVSEEVEKNPDLAEQVRQLEQAYDDDLLEMTENGEASGGPTSS